MLIMSHYELGFNNELQYTQVYDLILAFGDITAYDLEFLGE